jgi:hypothetical protein
MTVNAKIRKSDYNDIRTKVVNVLGPGSADFGYGAYVRSSAVSEENIVTVTQWGELYYDILNCYVHQTGSAPPSPTAPVANAIIKSDADSASFTGYTNGTTTLIATAMSTAQSMLAVGQTIISGTAAGRTITASLPNTSYTISALASKTTTNTNPIPTAPTPWYGGTLYLITFTVSTNVAFPVGGYCIIAGNSNSYYNGTFLITASTTTSVTLQYLSDPDKTTIVASRPAGSIGTTLKLAETINVFPGMTITGTGFTSGQTVVSVDPDGRTITTSAAPTTWPLGSEINATLLTSSQNGNSYEITVAGDTDFTLLGAASNTVGTVFTKTGGSGIGTGKVKQRLSSNLTFTFSYGSGTTTATMSNSDPWGYSTWQLSSSVPTATSATVAQNTSTLHPYTQYVTYADTIVTNRFVVHSTQSITSSKGSTSQEWPGIYGADWNGTIRSTVTVTFSTATAARYFFNSGGEIRFVSTRPNNGSTRAQDTTWSSLLTAAGTKTFGGAKPGTGVDPNNGLNYYRLSSAYQEWTSSVASSPYTNNQWRILARSRDVADNSTGTARIIDFLVEWVDGYVDPGNYFMDSPQDVDKVTGTITLAVSTLEAYGVLQPAGVGTISVESPSVTIGTIAP